MNRKLGLLIASLCLTSTAFTGCGPGADTNSFTFEDALGNYDVVLEQNVKLTGNYFTHISTHGTATSEALGLGTATLSDVSISYNAADHCFDVVAGPSGSSGSLIKIDEKNAEARDESGYVVPFSADPAKKLKSVTLYIPLGGVGTTALTNGCQSVVSTDLTFTMTADGISGALHVMQSYVTIGYQGALPYVSCQTWLAGEEALFRSGGTDTSSLPQFIVNGGVKIDTLTDLDSIEEALVFSGAKAVAATGSALVIENGGIVQLRSR